MLRENIYYMLMYTNVSEGKRAISATNCPFVHALLPLLHHALTSRTQAAQCHVTGCTVETKRRNKLHAAT